MKSFVFSEAVLVMCDVRCHLPLSANCRECFGITLLQQQTNLLFAVLK
jgi:hypothetical protein